MLFDFGVLFNGRANAARDGLLLDSWIKLLKNLNSWKENPWILLPPALNSLPRRFGFRFYRLGKRFPAL